MIKVDAKSKFRKRSTKGNESRMKKAIIQKSKIAKMKNTKMQK